VGRDRYYVEGLDLLRLACQQLQALRHGGVSKLLAPSNEVQLGFPPPSLEWLPMRDQ
jgi:hypothetical protein